MSVRAVEALGVLKQLLEEMSSDIVVTEGAELQAHEDG